MSIVHPLLKRAARLPRWGIAGIAFVVGAATLWLLVAGFDESVRLPDGRKVTVIAVTYGTNHVYVAGPLHARLARKFLSRSRAHKLGLRIFAQSSPWPSMMIWTRWHLPSTNAAPRFASVRDRHGIESEPAHAAIDAPYREKQMAIMGWRLQNFPRLESKFDLCFYERDPAYRPTHVGEITVRNLAEPQHGVTNAPFAPVVVQRGGLEFSLVSLRSGEPPPYALSNRYQFVAPPTVAWFEVRSHGQTDTNWMVRSVEAVGGSSNRFSLPQPVVLEANGRLGIAFSEVLWPDEPAWKLAVGFARMREFDPKTLVTLGPFPAVLLSKPFSTNLQVEARDVTFQTIGVRPTTWYLPFRRSPYRRTTDISVAYSSPEPTLRVDLARAVDDLGRDLRFGNGIDQARGRYLAGLEVLTNTTTVELTFAVQTSEVVEFVVRPVFAPGWKSSNRR